MVSRFMRYSGAAKNSPTRIRHIDAPERIGHHAVQALLEEGGGNAEHGFRPEPGGKHGRRDHVKGQAASGDGKVPGIVHAGGGVEADADRYDPIGDDEPEQHAIPPCETVKE